MKAAALATSAPAPKERPILFSGPMVRAILDGRKAQTRRMVKPQPDHGMEWASRGFESPCALYLDAWGNPIGTLRCPYGIPGDRLWVRETWWRGTSGGVEGYAVECHPAGPDNSYCKKVSSLYMPRWASRLTLEVTDVRVERLQDISEEDAHHEGWFFQNYPLGRTYDPVTMDAARRWFAELWDSINGKRAPWDANPWVWVVSFRRLP